MSDGDLVDLIDQKLNDRNATIDLLIALHVRRFTNLRILTEYMVSAKAHVEYEYERYNKT